MSFEVSGPVGDHPVGGGVGLIEGVVREGHEHFPQGLNGLIGEAVAAHALAERLELDIELFFLLLSHRPSQ